MMARMSANHKPDLLPSDPLRDRGRIRVGTVTAAKRDTRVCARGGYDGFTVDEVDRDLLLTGDVAQTALGYRYSNVLALVEDWRRGVFRTGADAT